MFLSKARAAFEVMRWFLSYLNGVLLHSYTVSMHSSRSHTLYFGHQNCSFRKPNSHRNDEKKKKFWLDFSEFRIILFFSFSILVILTSYIGIPFFPPWMTVNIFLVMVRAGIVSSPPRDPECKMSSNGKRTDGWMDGDGNSHNNDLEVPRFTQKNASRSCQRVCAKTQSSVMS